MNAIVLTEDQKSQLRAASAGSILTLEPRRLKDGRLILNADILDDPYFTDPSRPWAAILAGDPVVIEEPKPGEVAIGIEEAIAESLEQVRSEVVILTAADLAES